MYLRVDSLFWNMNFFVAIPFFQIQKTKHGSSDIYSFISLNVVVGCEIVTDAKSLVARIIC